MNDAATIIDKADTLREAAGDLAALYQSECDHELAAKIRRMFAELPDDSAARLLDILTAK